MTSRRTSQLLVLLAALFGVLAFVCACRTARPDNFPNGPSMEAWMDERGIERIADESEFPKLTEP